MSEWTKERIEDLSDQLAEFAEIPFSDQVDAIVEIERLQAENEKLRGLVEELSKFEDFLRRWLSKGNDEPMWYEDIMALLSSANEVLK